MYGVALPVMATTGVPLPMVKAVALELAAFQLPSTLAAADAVTE